MHRTCHPLTKRLHVWDGENAWLCICGLAAHQQNYRNDPTMNFVAQLEDYLRDLGAEARKKHPGVKEASDLG